MTAAVMLLQPAAQAVIRQKIDARMFSDERYIFRVQGSDKRFLFLDEADDNNSKFFVMAIDYYGEKQYHKADKSKFDPKDPDSIAYYLNTEFIEKGYYASMPKKTFKLPQPIIDHINFNHVWQCEEAGSDAPDPYKIKCGVALLSQTELIQYANKIGWDDNFKTKKYDFTPKPWAIRSTDSAYPENWNLAIRPEIDKTMINWLGYTSTAIGIRPCFWLDIDFFRENAIELSTMGEGVKEIFKKYYTIDEMLELYSRQDCYDYLGYTPDISISGGEMEVGLKNNRETEVGGLVMITYQDEGGMPLSQTCTPIKLGAKENRAVKVTQNAPAKAKYMRINVMSPAASFGTISNSIRINL